MRGKGHFSRRSRSYFADTGKTPISLTQKEVKYLSRGQKMQCAICRAFLGGQGIISRRAVVALDITHMITLPMSGARDGGAR
jgi:hypothetical protein